MTPYNESYPFKCKINYPFYHMDSEPFWNLVKSPDWEKRTEYSVNQLKLFYRYAEIDQDLFDLMQDPVSGAKIRACLKSMI